MGKYFLYPIFCFIILGALIPVKEKEAIFSLKLNINQPQPDSLNFIVENQYYKVKFGARQRMIDKFGNIDFCIRDWVLKSNQQDQVNTCMDGSALRPFVSNFEVIQNDKEKKVIKIFYGESPKVFVQQYTFYPSNKFIDIDYLTYPTDWFNTVDIGSPGGIDERYTASTSVFGQEEWMRDLVYHDDSYWTIDENSDSETISFENQPVIYKNHIIMLVENEKTGVGFGRIMPIWGEKNGGMRTLKLLWDVGFESFPLTGQQHIDQNKAFKGTVFLFDSGKEEAFYRAQKWIEKQNLIQ